MITSKPLIFLILSLTRFGRYSNVAAFSESICPNIRNANLENGGHQYCNCTYKLFRTNYTTSNLKLTSLLEKLRAWNCSQFEDECKNRRFDLNRFTFLVYEKFCNNSNFKQICSEELKIFNGNFYNSTSIKLRMYSKLLYLNKSKAHIKNAILMLKNNRFRWSFHAVFINILIGKSYNLLILMYENV